MADHRDVERTVDIDDLQCRTDGGDRVIEAYAAVFDRSAEVTDWAGHYHERIAAQAFDKTIQEQAGKIKVLFNHGKDLFGQPSERFSMPIGVPTEIRPDGRGLFTRSKISNTDLGDEVYTLAQDGAIDGFSFRAAFIQSRDLGKGADGLKTYERTEARLREYGPGVFPVYEGASITAVRAATLMTNMSDEERAALLEMIGPTFGPGPSSTEPVIHSEPTDNWQHEALRSVLAFDLKEFRDGPTGSAPS